MVLKTRLHELGVDYVKGRFPMFSFVVVDRNLYTGQNPASAAALVERMLEDFNKNK